MRKIILFVVMIILTTEYSVAKIEVKRDVVKGSYNFWIYTPRLTVDSASLPVVIFLHGRSLSGSNIDNVRRYGTIDAIEKGRNFEAVVVAPQCPLKQSWSPQKIDKLLDWVVENYKVDTNRVYLVGISLGGYGTLNYVGQYPQRVAAAVALCGGGDVKQAGNLAKVPLWIMHGGADKAVSIKESERVVGAMADLGDTSRLIFTRYDKSGHGDLARVLYSDKIYQWMLYHTKADSTQKVLLLPPIPLDKSVYHGLKFRK